MTELAIIYTCFGSSQHLVSLEITTIASLTKVMSTTIPTKKVTEKGVVLFIKYLLSPILSGFLLQQRHLLLFKLKMAVHAALLKKKTGEVKNF